MFSILQKLRLFSPWFARSCLYRASHLLHLANFHSGGSWAGGGRGREGGHGEDAKSWKGTLDVQIFGSIGGEYSAAGKVITRILAKYSKTKVETTHKLNCYPFNEGLKAGEIGQAFHQAGWMFFRLKNQRKNISGNPSAWHQIFLHFLIRPNISSCMMPRFLRQKGNTRTDNALLFPKPIHLLMMAMI